MPTQSSPDQSVDPTADERAPPDRTDGTPRVAVETSVPPEAPVHRCAYCGRPFAEASYLTLHRGLAHGDELPTDEREAFEAAYAEENADLRRFRIVALGLLVLLYFGFLFAFAIVT
jgi:hypothetical protein